MWRIRLISSNFVTRLADRETWFWIVLLVSGFDKCVMLGTTCATSGFGWSCPVLNVGIIFKLISVGHKSGLFTASVLSGNSACVARYLAFKIILVNAQSIPCTKSCFE